MKRLVNGFALVATLILCCGWLSGEAQAATQCINQNAPNPLEICVKDDGTPGVWVQQPNGRTRQYYGDYSWGSVIWLNGTATASRYTTEYAGFFTTTTKVSNVSNTKTGTGTAADPYVITNVTNLGSTGVRLTQVFKYVNGDRTLRKTWTLENTGATTFNDLRFFHGGDTYFGGIDQARSWYDATNNMIYVTNTGFTNSGLMGFYANPATPSARYFGGQYNTGESFAATTAQLPNTADSNYVDAGYQLQWNRSSLTPGEVWTIDSFETWSAPGAVQVIAPANDYVFPGTTVSRTFKVQNLTSNPLTISFSGAASPDGWTVNLLNGGSALVNGLQIVDVPVEVTVPGNAAPGATQDISLTATADSNVGVGTTRLTILQSDYAFSLNSLDFGDVAVGDSADLTLELTNGVAGLPVQIGPVAGVNGLATPFSIVSDTCSNTTVSASGSCTVTVRFTPTVLLPASDTFNFPILAPTITSQTIAVLGNQSAPTTHTVTASAGTGGSISPTSVSVNHGSTTAFTVTPNTGYSIGSVTGCGGSLSGNTYTTGAINSACAVTANFTLNSYTVSATAGAGGGISPASTSVDHGSTTSFTVTPNVGFSIASVTGCSGSRVGNTYTTGAITGACTVTASFTLNSYTVSASAGTGGGISPASSSVSHGSTTAFTVTPSTGYSIASVTGCGGSLTGNTYTTGTITGACSVSASFSLNSYTVTATAGTGGSISPGSASVNHGSSTSFMLVPNTGYSIAGAQGCGGTLVGNTFTTGAITGACAVTASFSLNSYNVTATAGNGGSISPASAVVNHGSTGSFTLTPDAGYSVETVSGCGGTLSGSSYTTGSITAACAISASFTLTKPTFSPANPVAFNLNSTGLLTDLPADLAPQAVDLNGTPIQVTLVGGQTRFAPGAYTLTWRAVDSRGVAATVEQVLHVWPIVSMGQDISLGYVQGNSGSFRIALNGPAPVYPFIVNYAVSGYLQDHDLSSGYAYFVNGEVEKDVYMAVTATAAPGASNQEVDVALDEDLNRGARHSLAIALVTENVQPSVTLTGYQENEARSVFARGAGPITLVADVLDPNSGDTHSVQWQSPNGASVTVNGGNLVFQADSLPAGVYHFEAIVTDNGAPSTTTRIAFDMVLSDTAPVLPNGASGWTPAGLPDDPEYSPVVRNVLPERQRVLDSYLIEGDPGLQLSLGTYALLQGLYQAELTASVIGNMPADSVQNIGGQFDFVVSGLPRVGQSINVVVPQRAPIPANSVYRKYDPAARRWSSFVENGTDKLASAPGAAGVCPPPGSGEYRPGLNAGDWCVRITLSDGGPNDADAQPNGVVADPGGVATMSSVVVNAKGKGGGGGALDAWWLLFGLSLLMLRTGRTRKALLAVFAGLSLPVLATAQEAGTWYFGAQMGPARGDVSEGDVNRRIESLGYNVSAVFDDQTRTAWRLFAGYQLSQYLGLQGGFTDLGTVDGSYTGSIIDIRGFLADANTIHPHSADGFELTVTGRYPLTRRVSVMGRGGVLAWNSSYHAANVDGEFDGLKRSGSDMLLGGGVEYAVFKGWTLSADWTRYRVGGESINFAGIGVVFRPH